MKYSIGDVVYAYVPFEDGKGVKPRPVIILNQNTEKLIYVVAECYSDKDHYAKNFGLLVKEGTDLYKEMGLKCSSFITSSIKAVYESKVIEKWGVYKNIEALKNKLRPKP